MATEQTLDTVNNANLKTVAESGAWTTSQRFIGSSAHQDRMDRYSEVLFSDLLEHRKHINLLATTYLGRVCDNASSIDPIEAISTAKAFKGESDSAVLSILSQLAGGQVAAKTAQSTPPTSASDTGVASLLGLLNATTNQNSQNSNAIATQNLALLNAMNHTNQATNATMAAIAQVLAKMAQTTPPYTGGQTGAGSGIV